MKISSDHPRAVAVAADETFAMMVNEEDHLRVHALRGGLQVDQAYEQINQIDDQIEQRLDLRVFGEVGLSDGVPDERGDGDSRIGDVASTGAEADGRD